MSTQPESHRRLAVIMFTDMVGYSALTQRNEALALELLEEHRRILRPQFSEYGGEEIKNMGDGFLVAFESALQAVICATQIQKAMMMRNKSAADRQVHVRIGLHAGDIVKQGDDVLGDGVNIAARIEPLAKPGGICVSQQVLDHVRGKVNLPSIQLRNASLKNISADVRVYRILLPWEPLPWWMRFVPFTIHTGGWKKNRMAFAGGALAVAAVAAMWIRPAALPPDTSTLSTLASKDAIHLESVGGAASRMLTIDTDGSPKMAPSADAGETSKWELADVQSDPARPRILIARINSPAKGLFLVSEDDGTLKLDRTADIRSQWMIYLDPTYEKTGAASIRRRTVDGSSNYLWLESNAANATLTISKNAAPGSGGLWRLQKLQAR